MFSWKKKAIVGYIISLWKIFTNWSLHPLIINKKKKKCSLKNGVRFTQSRTSKTQNYYFISFWTKIKWISNTINTVNASDKKNYFESEFFSHFSPSRRFFKFLKKTPGRETRLLLNEYESKIDESSIFTFEQI